MWFYWNSFPEMFIKVPQSPEPDNVKKLIELGGCSQDEAEAIAETLEDAIHHSCLREFSVIEGGVELYQPTEEFLKEFRKLLKELDYSYETVKVPGRQIILWG
jgi:hypothetical protein